MTLKRQPPQIGDLVCLTYNTNTIGIVTEVSDWTTTKFRYKVEWIKDQENILSRQNVLLILEPFHLISVLCVVTIPYICDYTYGICIVSKTDQIAYLWWLSF